jgi:hypothetical protein
MRRPASGSSTGPSSPPGPSPRCAWKPAAIPDDHALLAEVDDLRRTDPDVARWWNDHTVRDYASMPKRIAHPDAGLLDFAIEIVTAPHIPDQHIVVYTVEPNSPTARMLPILAGWTTVTDTAPAPHD